MLPIKKMWQIVVRVACLATFPAFGQVPHLINYQGKLTDAQDNPVTGSPPIVFSIYPTATGGAAVWTESYPSVAVTAGLFNVLLGSITPLNLPFDRDYYLGVKIGNDAEMAPRKRMVSVATAFRAENSANAARLEGKAAGEFAATSHLHDERYYTEAELNGDDGSPPNAGANRVHWNNLAGVPAGFTDGVDNEGSGSPITSVNGLAGGTITSGVTVNGNLGTQRHNLSVGNDNAVNAVATGDFATIFSESRGAQGTSHALSGYSRGTSGNGVWGRSEATRGGEFQTGNAGVYALYAFSANELDTNPGLFVRGTARITGGVTSSILTSAGELSSAAMLAPEAMMTFCGRGQLQNGEAFVPYAEALLPQAESSNGAMKNSAAIAREIFAAPQTVRVIITPSAACNGIYVAQKTAEGFIVRELLNGTSSATFDWMAAGVLKDREIKNSAERSIAATSAANAATAPTNGGARPAMNEH